MGFLKAYNKLNLNKKLMCSAVALGLLAGLSEGHATLNVYEENFLKPRIAAKGIKSEDMDIKVFGAMLSKFVPLLLEKWKEATTAGMSNADIRTAIGTTRNQEALDALTKGIAAKKNPGEPKAGDKPYTGPKRPLMTDLKGFADKKSGYLESKDGKLVIVHTLKDMQQYLTEKGFTKDTTLISFDYDGTLSADYTISKDMVAFLKQQNIPYFVNTAAGPTGTPSVWISFKQHLESDYDKVPPLFKNDCTLKFPGKINPKVMIEKPPVQIPYKDVKIGQCNLVFSAGYNKQEVVDYVLETYFKDKRPKVIHVEDSSQNALTMYKNGNISVYLPPSLETKHFGEPGQLESEEELYKIMTAAA